jgi:hypothetical protein
VFPARELVRPFKEIIFEDGCEAGFWGLRRILDEDGFHESLSGEFDIRRAEARAA